MATETAQKPNTARKISERRAELLASPDLLDMRPQLATLIATLEVYTGQIQDDHTLTATNMATISNTVDSAGKLYDRIDKVQARNNITADHLRAFYHRAAAIAVEFVPPERLQAFVEAMADPTREAIKTTLYVREDQPQPRQLTG